MTPPQPVFYYDVGEPECYLVAERIMAELPVVPEWEPVLARSLGPAPDTRPGRDDFERRVTELGLQPVRWPSNWPADTELAMLAATYAKRVGRAVAFSLAAFRQAFAGGRNLGDEGTVLIAAAACEMHPTAVLKGIGLRSVTSALAKAAERARADGALELPAISVGGRVFTGPGCIEEAAAAVLATAPTGP